MSEPRVSEKRLALRDQIAEKLRRRFTGGIRETYHLEVADWVLDFARRHGERCAKHVLAKVAEEYEARAHDARSMGASENDAAEIGSFATYLKARATMPLPEPEA